jgi:AAA+ ATPase superfamily predicted ATPase
MKNSKGALTVEACLSLTIFLMVFVTILYIMRIVFAYEIVQHALNQTAKEFSTYSYYYAVSGLADINGKIQSSTSEGISSFNENVTNVVNVYDKFGELGGGVKEVGSNIQSGNIDSTISSIQSLNGTYSEFKESIGSAKETFKSIAENPVAAIKSVGSVFLNGGNESAKTFLCGEISRSLMAKYISTSGYDAANKRLSNLRIKDGLEGLDFSSSVFWASGGENDIELVVCYTIDPVFPFKIIDELNLVNKVKVRGWSGKSIF